MTRLLHTEALERIIMVSVLIWRCDMIKRAAAKTRELVARKALVGSDLLGTDTTSDLTGDSRFTRPDLFFCRPSDTTTDTIVKNPHRPTHKKEAPKRRQFDRFGAWARQDSNLRPLDYEATRRRPQGVSQVSIPPQPAPFCPGSATATDTITDTHFPPTEGVQ